MGLSEKGSKKGKKWQKRKNEITALEFLPFLLLLAFFASYFTRAFK
jgi:hypothetical protein